jgi:hypothetical protein
MGYLHRMVTCPKCGRKIPWRETVSDDGTCRDCEKPGEVEKVEEYEVQRTQVGSIVEVRSGRRYRVIRLGVSPKGEAIAIVRASDGRGPVRYLPLKGLRKVEE